MAVVAISDSILTDIADAIRSKNGTENTYKPAQMPDAIEAISGGGITPTGTKEITSNGTGIDVASYAYADVAVPNSYSAGDEGKVVSSGTLVSQTSDTVTTNDTYDTTLINSLTVNVSGGSNDYDVVGGTVTPASNTNTIQVDVDFEPTHAICYANSMDVSDWTSSWSQFACIVFSTTFPKYISIQLRVINDAIQANPALRDISSVGYNNGKFKFYDGYAFLANKAYSWICWREKT